MVKKFRFDDNGTVEIGVDEVGRGPMFGPVYTGAVVLPKDSEDFDYSLLKDSKKFTSRKKLLAAAEYIKENAIYWSVTSESEKTIDKINILQATITSMHNSVSKILEQMTENEKQNLFLTVDGNQFRPYSFMTNDELYTIPHECFKGGDDLYSSIAAASILAKVERDNYILDLCEKYPKLKEYYSIDTNKGYGAKVHMDGIRKYGITKWHRRTFGACREAEMIDIS